MKNGTSDVERAEAGPAPLRRRPLALFVGALMAAIVLSGCAFRGGSIPYDVQDFGPPDRESTAIEGYDVPIGPLDVLQVNVFRVPELSGEFQVDFKGNINVPLVGGVQARDQSPEQFAETLERAYAERYLNNPDITIRVVSSNQNNVVVEGGVMAPGIYPLPGKTTLLGAIALARGVSVNDGNPKRVAIFRKQGGKTVAAAFDLVSIRHGEMEDPVVYPGDTIVVDGAGVRQLYRDLLQGLPFIFGIFTQL